MLGSRQAPAGPQGLATPSSSSKYSLRDVAARVFGTWRAPGLMEGVDVRRFLDVAPLIGSIRLPRPQAPTPQQQQHQQQQQREQQERQQLAQRIRQQQQHAEQRLVEHLEALKQQQAADAAAAAPAAAAARKPLRLSWAGSGVYFFWQLGAMTYLSQRYDLTRVPMVGASGGAICAILARCGVDPAEVSESAYKLALDHKIWEKPMGLAGSYGGVIEQWLHDLLPADAAERCRGELGVVVTEVPAWRQLSIDDFEDKVGAPGALAGAAGR